MPKPATRNVFIAEYWTDEARKLSIAALNAVVKNESEGSDRRKACLRELELREGIRSSVAKAESAKV